MTEKQFNVVNVGGTVFLEDHKEGSYHIGELGNVDVICLNDIADRLNGLTAKNKVLYKEIERLKRQNEDILYNNAKNIELLEKENEQLKKQLKCSREEADDYCEELMGKDEFVRLYKRQRDDALKENEQSKSIVKEVIELLSEEVDVFSDKATEHDINAYIELKELDNKDAYYMATATKKAIKLLKRVAND